MDDDTGKLILRFFFVVGLVLMALGITGLVKVDQETETTKWNLSLASLIVGIVVAWFCAKVGGIFW